MAEPNRKNKANGEDDSSLHRLVWDDLRESDFVGTLSRDFKDLYRFYLDQERRERLETMNRFLRAFWLTGWIFKSLLLKLSPARRLLWLVALIMAIMGWTTFTFQGATIQFDFRPWAFLILLVILMLELKDKLLAKDEIQVARQVQLALLPTRHPDLHGWKVWSYSVPANDVGGDLVDYIEIGPDRLGVVLGDVSGKGLGAALLAAKLQATLRALGPDSPSLDELGSRVNNILHVDSLANRFATMFYTELSPDSGHIRYLNAGHNPPFLIHGGALEELTASSYPLGMLSEATYTEGMVDMEPGDLLVAYSDGLSEATNEAGQEFGVDRLREMLPDLQSVPLEQAGRIVLKAVEQYLAGERPQDDLSVVLVRKT
jgi:hypothetical protein